MGRHSVPSTGEPAVSLRTKVAGVALATVAVVAVAIAAAVFAFGPDDDTTTTDATSNGARSTATQEVSASATPSVSTSASTSASPTSTSTPSATAATKRPPTLVIRVVGRSFVTVRTPDGRTLVSRLFTKGQHKAFDNKVLRVTIGNSAAARVEINGKLLKPGRAGEVAAFTARRK